MIHVVAAVIVKDGRILLTQRDSARSDYGYKWECPGGKVEDGENDVAAVLREVREELGTSGSVGRRITSTVVPRGNGDRCHLTFYEVSMLEDEAFKPLVALGIGWFTAREMRHLDLAPANLLCLEAISVQLG